LGRPGAGRAWLEMGLTAALAILGGLVLAGVIAHGAWSARRATPRQGAMMAPVREPELREPSLDEPTVPVAYGDTLTPEIKPPAIARKPSPRLDALIDVMATLTLEAPVSGELALTHLPPTRRAGSKPFLIEGLNAESGEWELPRPGQRYGEFQAGVQMANRLGALNEIEYSEFVQKVQAFAEGVGAMADMPDMLEAVSRARELDHFASQHDAQLALVLRSNGVAWSVGYLQQNAARHGFVPGSVPGRLVLPAADEGAPPLLTLAFDAQAALSDDPAQAVVREAVLGLDVPQTPSEIEPFAAWQEAARALSADLDALLVDDAGHPLPLQAFAAIGQELNELYKALEGRDLAAGTPAARRLFS
jgi:hypothetical protein